jgi:3-oxoadipate enol-lactonase
VKSQPLETARRWSDNLRHILQWKDTARMTNVTYGSVEVNGAQLSYEVAGAGPPFVMLHGHLLDRRQWDHEFGRFAADYLVMRFDARGFGQSSQPDAPFAFYEDLRGLMDTLLIERAVLMGCSGGGATIIDFALAYPDRVAALLLVGSGLGGYPMPTEPPLLAVEMREAFSRGDIARAVELALRMWTDGEGRTPEQVNPAVRERTREMHQQLFARPRMEEEARGLAPPAVGRLTELLAPTLVIVGANDLGFIREIADVITAQAPNARKVVIPDAGHHPNMEHPELFEQVVREFLATHA